MPRTCKICADDCWILINYLRLVKGYSYNRLIECFGWCIHNLNKANLSNHFNRHIQPYALEMLEDLEEFEPFPSPVLEFMDAFREDWLKRRNMRNSPQIFVENE